LKKIHVLDVRGKEILREKKKIRKSPSVPAIRKKALTKHYTH
jgi:hypothetical protein